MRATCLSAFILFSVTFQCASAQSMLKDLGDLGVDTPELTQSLRDAIQSLQKLQSIYEEEPSILSEKALKDIDITINNLRADAKVVYGGDDRKNYFDATDQEKFASRAVALVVNNSDLLSADNEEVINLPSKTVGLCSSEPFHQEPAPGFCSAFRVGEDLIATAGHCITSVKACDATSFVFGFKMDDADDTPEKGIPRDQVYACVEIIDGELNGPDQSDWRVVRVDRAISEDVPTVKVRDQGLIDIGDEITIIGHPMGLPLKVTPKGTVRAHASSYFVANPDTYGGNSGSAAFNSRKLEDGELFVEGILVRGEEDFVQFSPCMISKICPIDSCRGEDITYASEFLSAIAK